MLFLDVSSYQGSIDFKRARHSNRQLAGVWIKASEGTNYRNPYMGKQARDARAAGLRVGFYHFARPDRGFGPGSEAKFFWRTIEPYSTRRDLKPVLDFETWDRHMSGGEHVAWARKFSQTMRALSGGFPIFYSYGPFIDRMAPEKPIGAGLWLAAYGRNDGFPYPVRPARPWKRIVAHQFSSQCRVAGCSGYVDMTVAPRLAPLLAHPIKGRIP